MTSRRRRRAVIRRVMTTEPVPRVSKFMSPNSAGGESGTRGRSRHDAVTLAQFGRSSRIDATSFGRSCKKKIQKRTREEPEIGKMGKKKKTSITINLSLVGNHSTTSVLSSFTFYFYFWGLLAQKSFSSS